MFTRNQHVDETIDQYVTDLRNKASSCEFEQLMDGLIRDKIVCGIKSDNVRARLLREPKLDLQKAIDIVRASESVAGQMKVLQDTVGDKSVNTLKQKSSPGKSFHNRTRRQQKYGDCKYCGSKHEKGRCPAYGKECSVCHKKHHFASVCRNKRPYQGTSGRRRVHLLENHDCDEDSDTSTEFDEPHGSDHLYIDCITTNDYEEDEWRMTLDIHGKKVYFKIDTGTM